MEEEDEENGGGEERREQEKPEDRSLWFGKNYNLLAWFTRRTATQAELTNAQWASRMRPTGNKICDLLEIGGLGSCRLGNSGLQQVRKYEELSDIGVFHDHGPSVFNHALSIWSYLPSHIFKVLLRGAGARSTVENSVMRIVFCCFSINIDPWSI